MVYKTKYILISRYISRICYIVEHMRVCNDCPSYARHLMVIIYPYKNLYMFFYIEYIINMFYILKSNINRSISEFDFVKIFRFLIVRLCSISHLATMQYFDCNINVMNLPLNNIESISTLNECYRDISIIWKMHTRYIIYNKWLFVHSFCNITRKIFIIYFILNNIRDIVHFTLIGFDYLKYVKMRAW